MPQKPSAIALMLCDQVVIEQGTLKPYLLGVFTGIAASSFPTGPQRLDVFAALTDGLGHVTIVLTVIHLETNKQIYAQEMQMDFPDPLQIINLRFRVRRLVFDEGGTYLFALTVNDQEIAARRVRVYLKEE